KQLPVLRETRMAQWYSYIIKENMYGFGIQLVTLLSGLLFAAIFPNLLGAEEFGYFSITLAYMNMWLFLGDFGISSSVFRFVPLGLKKKAAGAYYALLLRWKLLLSLLASALLFLLANIIAVELYHLPFLSSGLRVGSAFVLFYSLFVFYDATLTAIKKAKYSLFANVVFYSLRILAPVLVFMVFPNYVGVIFGLALASLAAFICAYLLSRKSEALSERGKAALRVQEIKKFAGYLTLSHVADNFIAWADTLIIGLSQSVSQVAYYKVALLWVSAASVLNPFAHRVFFSAYSFEDAARSGKMFARMLRYGFVFAFLMLLGMLLLGRKFLSLIYGSQFLPAYEVLVVLAFLVFETGLNSASYPFLLGKGHVRFYTCARIAIGFLQTALCLLLTPTYGIMSTALVVMGCRVGGALAAAGYSMLKLGVRADASLLLKPFLCAALVFLVTQPLVAQVHDVYAGIAIGVWTVLGYSALLLITRTVSISDASAVLRALGR
ncbi:MAG: oligosaccharide flippase family protein, partial [Candidatus Micrarchaeota archaeon]